MVCYSKLLFPGVRVVVSIGTDVVVTLFPVKPIVDRICVKIEVFWSVV